MVSKKAVSTRLWSNRRKLIAKGINPLVAAKRRFRAQNRRLELQRSIERFITTVSDQHSNRMSTKSEAQLALSVTS